MVLQKEAEEGIAADREANGCKGGDEENSLMASPARLNNMKSLLWHGGSVYDAWFSCASNQVIFLALEKILSF